MNLWKEGARGKPALVLLLQPGAKSLTLRISLFKLSQNPHAPTLTSAGIDNLLIVGEG